MPEITVKKYSEQYFSSLTSFISSHPESMFFHSLKYLFFVTDLLRSEQHHLIAVNDKDEVVGFLPLLISKGELGKVLNSSPYYGSNGGALGKDQQVIDMLLNEYNLLAVKKEIASATWISGLLSNADLSKLVTHNYDDYRIGQFSKIDFDNRHGDKLMEMFHSKTRNMVRKAMKFEMNISVENDQMNFLMNTHFENMKSIGGKAKSTDFFEKIPKYFTPGQDFKIWIARYNNEPIAALLLFYFRDMVEYYTPVIKEEHRDKQSLSLLIFESMKEASEKGYKLWNWGGTWATQDGVYTFKKRWGTIDKNYYYYTQINNREILNSTKEKLEMEYPGFFVVPYSSIVNKN